MAVGPWGRRQTPETEAKPAAPPRNVDQQLSCEQCGAVLSYAPGTQNITCEYCGYSNEIEDRPVEIIEHDLDAAIDQASGQNSLEQDVQTVKCTTCGAGFTFDPDRHAGSCPFCGQAIVTTTGSHRQIKPAAILPFAIREDEAQATIRRWLKGLWFAPSKLTKFGKVDGSISGVYLPYWTYDSQTDTNYTGQRGETYLEPVRVTRTVKGKRVVRTEMVQKVRWYPARGRVKRFFDDVLVLASYSLPHWLTDKLEPWDLSDLRPYTEQYVAGFQSEAYQIALKDGFGVANKKMQARIAADVRLDIGGDLQKIHRMDVRHSDSTFKHVLLPLWIGAFRFGDTTYRVAVNARTGDVQGERPYSVWKIAIAIILALIVAGALYGIGQLAS
ncbi:MAG: primosomal protein N' (replication factor Y) - superfamily II helicase [Pseudomonadota bacterium]